MTANAKHVKFLYPGAGDRKTRTVEVERTSSVDDLLNQAGLRGEFDVFWTEKKRMTDPGERPYDHMGSTEEFVVTPRAFAG